MLSILLTFLSFVTAAKSSHRHVKWVIVTVTYFGVAPNVLCSCVITTPHHIVIISAEGSCQAAVIWTPVFESRSSLMNLMEGGWRRDREREREFCLHVHHVCGMTSWKRNSCVRECVCKQVCAAVSVQQFLGSSWGAHQVCRMPEKRHKQWGYNAFLCPPLATSDCKQHSSHARASALTFDRIKTK